MILPLRYYGDPILRAKAKPVTKFDNELKQLAWSMIESLETHHAWGLAAPQVGHSIQLFCGDLLDGWKRGFHFEYTLDGKTPPLEILFPIYLVNPEIVEVSKTMDVFDQGCASFPGNIRADVAMPNFVRMRYQDLDGTQHEITGDGLFARLLLHEYDHLAGILFTDRISKRDLERLKPKLKALERKTQEQLKAAKAKETSAQG